MNAVIIEDEPPTAERLCEFIKQYDSKIEITAKLSGVNESVEWFRKNRLPSLLFADIELLDGNIFRLFENVEINCPIIFTTAYDQFLLQAFEKNGIAYLLKPYSFEKFSVAMRKFEKLKDNFSSAQNEFWREMQSTLTQPKYKERFIVKTRGVIQVLAAEQVAYVQIQNEIPFAFDFAGNRFQLNETISGLEQSLNPNNFFRLNRGEIVNLKAIEQLKPDFQDRLVIRLQNSGKKLVCSKTRTPLLRKWLGGE
jgi:two-component system, LytTR family, response regulator LytT